MIDVDAQPAAAGPARVAVVAGAKLAEAVAVFIAELVPAEIAVPAADQVTEVVTEAEPAGPSATGLAGDPMLAAQAASGGTASGKPEDPSTRRSDRLGACRARTEAGRGRRGVGRFLGPMVQPILAMASAALA
jgi:hypothetical protein